MKQLLRLFPLRCFGAPPKNRPALPIANVCRFRVLLFGIILLERVTGAAAEGPIIDVHLHAIRPRLYSRPPNPVTGKVPTARTPEEHMRATLAEMEKHHVVLGLVSGPLEELEKWRRAAPERIVAGPSFGRPDIDDAEVRFTLDDLRERFADGRLGLMGEITAQYEGLSPSDARLAPYFALAAEMDVPVGVHTGTSAPGTPLRHPGAGRADPEFRLRFGNPLLLEDVLVRHPRLRVFLMHAGDPWLVETLAMLRMYPDLHVDLSVKNWVYPREVFHRYLKALVDAGYVKRLMFGSDQQVWPETIGMAIDGIDSAPFLSAEDKRDIFCHNPVRFFRLEKRMADNR